ncbi:MAG: glycosyltransferase family 4 protein [Chloroflexi bacterium]|nr:glycosyltransferase family 4 protein [Chloroflexota bacterium]
MQILVEASEAYRNSSGIGRFSRELLRHLLHAQDANPNGLKLHYSPPDYAGRTHSNGTRSRTQRLTHFAEHFRLTQVEASWAARRIRPDVLHSLSFFAPLAAGSTPIVITCFDLAYFDLPDETDPYWGAYARRMMPVFARRAAIILTTSQTMRGQIIERFGVPAERVHVVHGAANSHFAPVSDPETLAKVRSRYDLPDVFVLYVGGWRSSKNLPTLFEAGQHAGIPIVLAGTPHANAEREQVEAARRAGADVRTLGYVPDELLPALYSLAAMVVLPSLQEGFGLPLVEAMTCGAPVIHSDLPVLNEITGEAALRFPARDADALGDLLSRTAGSETLRNDLRQRGLAQAKCYTWEATAAQVVKVWQSL